MTIHETDFKNAQNRMEAEREAGHALAVRFDPQSRRIVVTLNTGVELAVPAEQIEGLADARDEELASITISPSGLGLSWPDLDADIHIPSLLRGIFGSRQWMAAHLGAEGGRSRSESKVAAARQNGRKGGRPKKTVPA